MVKRRILAWDAPNMDMCIAQLLGCKPTPVYRPDFVALARWFVRGGEGVAPAHAFPPTIDEAAVFVNVPDHLTERLRQWVMWLTASGYRVFAKPKHEGSDIDAEMVEYICGVPTAELSEVVIASHDAANFADPLHALAEAGVTITVIGFAEFAGSLSKSHHISFMDLESIPGLFAKPLPRVDLRTLPPEGRWFEPRGPLGIALVPAVHPEDAVLHPDDALPHAAVTGGAVAADALTTAQ